MSGRTVVSSESKWIRCPGCSGQIGVPTKWPAEVVTCPKCAAVVRIDERMRVLWKPFAQRTPVAPPIEPAQWVACRGCGGQIGVPTGWFGPTIACPKCGAIVAMRATGRVLWRPPLVTPVAAADKADLLAHAAGAGRASAPAVVRWRLHVFAFLACFVGLQLLPAVFLSHAQRLQDMMPLGAAAAVAGLAFCTAIAVCWCVAIVKMIRHDQLLLAALFFFAPAVACGIVVASSVHDGEKLVYCCAVIATCLLFTFLYGWGNAALLQATRLMVVWTYSIALGISLTAMVATTLAAMNVLEIH
jgi:hypothetical protein